MTKQIIKKTQIIISTQFFLYQRLVNLHNNLVHLLYTQKLIELVILFDTVFNKMMMLVKITKIYSVPNALSFST